MVANSCFSYPLIGYLDCQGSYIYNKQSFLCLLCVEKVEIKVQLEVCFVCHLSLLNPVTTIEIRFCQNPTMPTVFIDLLSLLLSRKWCIRFVNIDHYYEYRVPKPLCKVGRTVALHISASLAIMEALTRLQVNNISVTYCIFFPDFPS